MDAPDVVESAPATKKLRSVTEDKAASLLHKQSWNEIDDGILTTGPESSYELTELKIPSVETPTEK